MSVLAPRLIQQADANPAFDRLVDSEEAASLLQLHPKTPHRRERAAFLRWLSRQVCPHCGVQYGAEDCVTDECEASQIRGQTQQTIKN